MSILLIEDNEMLAKGLAYSFKQNGYLLKHTTTIQESKILLEKETVNLIILDILLPDGNGLRFYEEIIQSKKIPTIFLTAKDDEETIVKGFELGADDYITKPFSTRELMARVNRILRREEKNLIVQVKDIEFDFDKMVVYKNKKELILTSLELKIFHLLFSNLNKVVTRNEIIEKIWEWTGNDVNDNTVTVYLKRIRQKIDSNIIVTVKGIGYRVDKT